VEKKIVTSLGDTDLYKASMGNCVFENYPKATASYEFVCRSGENLGFLTGQAREQHQMMQNSCLSFSDGEFGLLRSLGWLGEAYLGEMAKGFCLDQPNVRIWDNSGKLGIVVHGLWYEAMMLEVPLLATVNELYFRHIFGEEPEGLFAEGERRLRNKIALLKQYPRVKVADFGTRRRFSAKWHDTVVRILSEELPGQFVGTSNIMLAHKYGVKPIGTMAHEFVSGHLSLVPSVRLAQSRALYTWLQTYKTNLGIVLSDTFTSKAFFTDFDVVLARAFSGVRQDSGDPVLFCKRAIAHYNLMGIDSRTKTVIFSDSLTVPKAIEIWKQFAGMIGMSFGIGTNLTNDLGPAPLNIVIKMTHCDGKPVCKISDDVGKAISGSPKVLEEVAAAYDIDLKARQ